MYNNCMPCCCRYMIRLIQKIAEKVCQTKMGELMKALPTIVEEIAKRVIDETVPGLVNEIVNQVIDEKISALGLIGIQAQLYASPGIPREIPHGGIVPFTFVINNTSDITLSAGEFTIAKTGNYLINWSVIDAVGEDPYSGFAINVNNISKTQSSRMHFNAPIDTGSMVSLTAGDIVTLKNISGQTVALASHSAPRQGAINFQANITITYFGNALQ